MSMLRRPMKKLLLRLHSIRIFFTDSSDSSYEYLSCIEDLLLSMVLDLMELREILLLF